MPLTDQQLAAVQVLDWLLDDSDQQRQTGRSMAFSIALVRKALREPGRQVYYVDHVLGMERARFAQQGMVSALIHSDPSLRRLRWRFLNDRFNLVADVPELIPVDWWPSADLLGTNENFPKPRPPRAKKPAIIRRSVWERLRTDEDTLAGPE
jgi:hypothetical protein